MSDDRERLAKDAKDALTALHSARIRCRDANLSPLFIDLDPEYEKMTRAAALKAVRLSDPRASRGAIRIVRREAETVLSLIAGAEAAMREQSA
jgi:hypothetical protein